MDSLAKPTAFPLGRGAHVCHLFHGAGHQKSVILPFLLEGLKQGESCLYITGRQSVDDWYFELQASGIDVPQELERKALAIITSAEFGQPRSFNSIIKAAELLHFIEDRLTEFAGVRIAADVAWEWDPPLPPDKLCHWEATANLIFEDQDVRTICEYDLGSHSPAAIHAALRTHPQVVLGGVLYSNPFYEASRILENEPYLNDSDADARLIESMLRHFQFAPDLRLRL
jgi:two-component system, sensor histidine kinase PdtaS